MSLSFFSGLMMSLPAYMGILKSLPATNCTMNTTIELIFKMFSEKLMQPPENSQKSARY